MKTNENSPEPNRNLSRYQQALIFILSNLGWFACVYSDVYGLTIFSYAVPLIFILILHYIKPFNLFEVKNIFRLAIIGALFDAVALNWGWITLKNTPEFYLPHWLISLWLLFAFTLPLYAQWFGRQWLKPLLLGLVFGPLAYKSGEVMGVLYFTNFKSVIYYGIFWALYLPLSIHLLNPKKSVLT